MKNRAIALSFAVCTTPVAAFADGIEPVDQAELNAMPPNAAFLEAFELGDELTEFNFDASHGVGANIGEGRRFSRVPRADLAGPEEWASHFPVREGGANATSCIACHNAPFANGAGDVAVNAIVDPAHTGNPSMYLERNTLPLFALGVPQLLAEEISSDLFRLRDAAYETACSKGAATANLSSKGVDYGTLTMTRTADNPCQVATDTSGLLGIDEDLVIKAFGWKGNHATIRAFTRGAAHNELGMQAVELVGDRDGDFDGVTHELTVGDMTAMTIYMAALERPVTTIELADLGLAELSARDRADINSGQQLFGAVGCASCHVPSMELQNAVFSEPSATPGFYDVVFPDGSAPSDRNLSQETAVHFDVTKDQPNNQITLKDGTPYHLGALQVNANGAAVAHWFTDFKRHDMGNALADPDDPLGLGAGMFLTRSLAGVGSTGPWLHDGRATTLTEAIEAHGGEARDATDHFRALDAKHQAQIIAYLENLVIYKDAH